MAEAKFFGSSFALLFDIKFQSFELRSQEKGMLQMIIRNYHVS
jgi:hypothetical protein